MKLNEIEKQGWYWMRYPLMSTPDKRVAHTQCVYVIPDFGNKKTAFHGEKPVHRCHTDAATFIGPITPPSPEDFEVKR